jgi:hypothetical protein
MQNLRQGNFLLSRKEADKTEISGARKLMFIIMGIKEGKIISERGCGGP